MKTTKKTKLATLRSSQLVQVVGGGGLMSLLNTSVVRPETVGTM